MQLLEALKAPDSIALSASSRAPFGEDFNGFKGVEKKPCIDASSFYASLPIRPSTGGPTHPHTPPESHSGSPKLKTEDTQLKLSEDNSPLARLPPFQNAPSSPVKLPSMMEFVEGVEALARCNPPLPRMTPKNAVVPRRKPCKRLFAPGPFPAYLLSQSGEPPSMPGPYDSSPSIDHAVATPVYIDGYPSPPPESESKRINQKYTVEEGDYIIYAWHDKKMKWTRIEQEFADLFGRTPKRTASGLQAWYYRMNQRIPVWDQEGWLCFGDDDELDPKCISIKCRESQDRPLGLAQRYPERAIQYPWVDAELKCKARDWATKRAIQYHQRKERRKHREQAQSQAKL